MKICILCSKSRKDYHSDKDQKHFFCSCKCANIFKGQQRLGKKDSSKYTRVRCDKCNKYFPKPNWLMKRGNKYHFCNPKCYYKFLREDNVGQKSRNWRGGEKKAQTRYQNSPKGIANKQRHYTAHQDISDKIIELLKKQSEGKCSYCKCNLDFNKRRTKNGATIDHKIPLSKGGHSNIENLIFCCFSCNARKKDKIWNKNIMD